MNPENLSIKELKRKIEHLEKSVTTCYIRSGPLFCKNREKRLKLLKTYLNEAKEEATYE